MVVLLVAKAFGVASKVELKSGVLDKIHAK